MITGQITDREYIAAGHLHRRRMVAIGRRLLAALFGGGLLLFFLVGKRPGLALMGGAIGGVIGEFIQSRFFLTPKLRQLYGQIKGIGDVTYTWDDERLYFTYENGQGSRAWSDFLKARENEELMLLYVNDAMYELVAKRWFATAADLDAFRKHLKFVD